MFAALRGDDEHDFGRETARIGLAHNARVMKREGVKNNKKIEGVWCFREESTSSKGFNNNKKYI